MHAKEIDHILQARADEPPVEYARGVRFASLRCKTRRSMPADARRALALQSNWPGPAKMVTSGRRQLHARADLPLLDGGTACRAWMEVQLQLSVQALRQIAGHRIQTTEASARHDSQHLAALCAQAGWDALAQLDGACRMEIRSRGCLRTLALTPEGSAIRARVALSKDLLGDANAQCLTAAAHFLLQASDAMQWVRAYLHLDEAGRALDAGFECSMATPIVDVALALAIDALIGACEWYAPEAELLLEHSDMAALYLSHQDARAPRETKPLTGGTQARDDNAFHPA